MNPHADDDTQLLSLMENANGWIAAGAIEAALERDGHPVPRRTLGRKLTNLAQAGVIEQRGKGRSVEYRVSAVALWFRTPPDQRPTIHYQASRCGDYIPNQTYWLSQAQRDQLLAAQPPRETAGSYPLAVAEKLIVDLSYASSSLEGNTYNYLDTETLVRYGQAASGKDISETTMILNHKEAVSYLVSVAQDDAPVSKRALCELHSLLGQDLIDVRELGALRKRKVGIGGSAYIPLDVPTRIEEAFLELIAKANAIDDPFEQSLFWMTQIAYLQPFVDINKRTGRLACNIPLLRANKAPLSFMSMDKTAYVKGLLEFYELGATKTITNAFVDAYVKSAHRYEVHVTRDPAAALMDRSHKQELGQIVRDWVRATVQDDPETWDDIVQSCLTHVSDVGLRQAIDARARTLVDSLNEGNRIIYGVPPDDYQAFSQRQSPQPATRKPSRP